MNPNLWYVNCNKHKIFVGESESKAPTISDRMPCGRIHVHIHKHRAQAHSEQTEHLRFFIWLLGDCAWLDLRNLGKQGTGNQGPGILVVLEKEGKIVFWESNVECLYIGVGVCEPQREVQLHSREKRPL